MAIDIKIKSEIEPIVKVVIVYRVLQHWRLPFFRRLGDFFDLFLLHGGDVAGTKIVNAKNVSHVKHHEMLTLSLRLRTSGRDAVLVFSPSLLYHLFRSKPDVIVVEGGSNIFNNVAVYLYSFVFRKPIVWWTLGELPGRKYSLVGKLYRSLVSWMEHRSAALIGYSSVAMEYFDRMGYEHGKCFKAVNCVDTESIQKDNYCARRIDELRSELNLNKRKSILFVGALTPEKRIDRLINAFFWVSKEVEEARLIIIGEGPVLDELKQAVASLGISEKVLFMGKIIEGVGYYFKLASVFVLPGLGGLAVSEALAHGVPVICTVGDGCEVDLVVDGQTGFRISEDNEVECVNEMADKMIRILNDDSFRDSLSCGALDMIKNRYNINNYVSSVAEAIHFAYSKKGTTNEREPKKG